MNMNDLLNNINEIEEDMYLDDNIVNISSHNRVNILKNNKIIKNIKLIIELYLEDNKNINYINNNKRINKIMDLIRMNITLKQIYNNDINNIINKYYNENCLLILYYNNNKQFIKLNNINHFINILKEYYDDDNIIINHINLDEL